MKSHPIKLSKAYGVYVDYTLEATPRAFYVGKGQQARVKSVRRNRHHTNISKKYGIRRELVFETDDSTDAAAKEVELIATLKTYVYGDGYVFGANYTIGGEGAPGRKYKPTLETRKLIGDAQRGKKCGPWTPEQRAARIAGMRGKKHVIKDMDTYRKRCSENQKLRMQDPELRKRTGDSTRGKPGHARGKKYTPEQRADRSRQLKEAWARRREEAAQKGERVTIKPQTPEQRKIKSDALKAHWAKKRVEKVEHEQ